MRSRLLTLAVVLALVVSAAPLPAVSVHAAPLQGGLVRILGPRGETTPVVNEHNQLQLHVDGAGSVSHWATDSPDVATVSSTGVLSGNRYGFATITAQTGGGTAQVIVVVVRKTPRRASRVQGDTKTDTGGNVYLSSPQKHVIIKSGAAGTGVLAGTAGQAGYQDGVGAQARFNVPTGMGVDQSARGGIYVADTENHCIRRIGPSGSVSAVVGMPQHAGRMVADRTPIEDAMLDGPRGVVVAGGNLMVADTENHCIWYVDLEHKEIRIVAGEPGTPGTDNGRGRAARFNRPSGLAVSTDGRLVAVADTSNNLVRLIAIGAEEGHATYDVTTLGQASSKRGVEVSKLWGEDRVADSLVFDAPESVSIDGVGNVYVIDATAASVVTRSPDKVEKVDLAQAGTLGDPASVTLSGTQAYVLDAAASTDEAVNVVEVGAPEITGLTPEFAGLAGGQTIIIEGRNFAPESELTLGGAVVRDFGVESATRITFVTQAQSIPGARTLTVATRGGLGQRAFDVRGKRLDDLAPGEITTPAGGKLSYFGDGGPATLANLARPYGVAFDGLGNLYIADQFQHRVRRVDATGRITTVAGGDVGGYDDGGYNGDDKPATTARLFNPSGVVVDGSGNLYIADSSNGRIRRVDPTGFITTVAGGGSQQHDGGPATSARLSSPMGVAVDGLGNLYIADSVSNRVRRVDAEGKIATVAGTGDQGYNGDNRPATSAHLTYPTGIAIDVSGNLYIAEGIRVRRVDTAGRITTVAGGGADEGDGGPATSASISPSGVAIDESGNLYIAEGSRIRRVDTAGRITTVAGGGGDNGDGVPATSASIEPSGVAIDESGNFYIADADNHRVRRVDTAGRIATIAGTGAQGFGYNGDNQPATAASLSNPKGVAIDGSGNIFIADYYNDRVRRVDTAGIITTVAGNGDYGYNGDNIPATSAMLASPSGVTVDGLGNLYIADTANSRIRRVDASGLITTVAGTDVAGSDGDGGQATSARLDYPTGVAVDESGNLFIADSENNRIRRVDASGTITTFAGTGESGYNGDHRAATSASLYRPSGVTVDGSGNVYIADTFHSRIRRVDAAGLITTIAGTGSPFYNGDDKPAISANLFAPYGVAVDKAGNVYIADTDQNYEVPYYNSRIRRVDVTGRITTIAGRGVEGFDGDDKPATSAHLFNPNGVAVDESGNLFIADTANNAIRAVRQPGSVTRDSAPSLGVVIFNATLGKLVVKGSGFGSSGAVVTVNGTDVSSHIRKQTDGRVVLRSLAGELGLHSGPNEITVASNGSTSAVFVLTL